MRKDIGEFKLKLSSQRENFKNSDEGLLKNVVKVKRFSLNKMPFFIFRKKMQR